MYKCSHFLMIVISGIIWTMVGILLMTLGMHHLMDALRLWDEIIVSSHLSMIKMLSYVFHRPEQVLVAIVAVCLLAGYSKGHFVLMRSVKTGVQRILSYPNPSEIKNLYTKKYYFLLFFMMGLGILLRVAKIPEDIHGAIDLAIGSALLKGALGYFKYALAEKKGTLAQEKW